MALHAFALQEALYSRLNGDGTLGSLVTGVYDAVPEDTVLPAVVIGTRTTTDDGTNTLDARDYVFNIDVWSAYSGMKEIKNIMKQVYALLHESSLTVSGASLVNLRFEFSDIINENDGLTTHGLQRFRAVIYDS